MLSPSFLCNYYQNILDLILSSTLTCILIVGALSNMISINQMQVFGLGPNW